MNPVALAAGFLRSQENRLFTLHSPVPQAGLLLDRFEGTEAVSAPFRFTLRLVSERADLDLRDFLGRPFGLSLRTASGAGRHFHGHATDFQHTGSDGGLSHYEAVLGPWTDFLDRRINCRLYQNKPLPGILQDLLGDYGHLARYELKVQDAAFRPITLCAQYGETDFRFLSRLLEAHGLHYYFRFEEDGHILVIADDSTLAPAIPGAPCLSFNAIPGAAKEDTIDAWSAAQHLVPTALAIKTHNFKDPREPMQAREKTLLPTGSLPAMEDYRYAGAYGFPDFTAGQKLVRIRMEVHEAQAETFTGASNCRALTCGHGFELLGHFRGGPTIHDRKFFVTRVTHEGSNNYLNERSRSDYRNVFQCVPKLVPWRPPLATPRPLIHGPQTATVVGPPGEEIYCDAHGRVKLQFHWDRQGQFNDASSCWVRVSTPWAGSRFGLIAVPRIGQEVVVEFLDGDPDRPLITGHVYNELKRPPWELPANRTQTGLLTRSTPEGAQDHANALRFEDKKGEEEIWLHAEKDQRIEVEHDESHTVDHDRAKKIGNDETTEVGHDRTETVGNDEQVEIAANQGLKVGKTQTITVRGAKSETVALASLEQVGGAKTLTVREAYRVTVSGAKTEAVTRDSAEQVGGARQTRVGKTYTITAGDQLSITVGGSSLVLASDGTITLSGKRISIQAAETLKLQGKDVEAN